MDKQAAKLKGALNMFVSSMVQNQESRLRFTQLEKKEEAQIAELAEQEYNLINKENAEKAQDQNGASFDHYMDEIEKLSQSQDGADGGRADLAEDQGGFQKQKELMIEKIAETLYQTEYTYLEYLNHLLTQCVHSTTVEGGCPLSKCKLKSPVGFDQLRLHLVNECTKIMLECEQCKDRLRRPWIEHHDCRRAYAKRLT